MMIIIYVFKLYVSSRGKFLESLLRWVILFATGGVNCTKLVGDYKSTTSNANTYLPNYW